MCMLPGDECVFICVSCLEVPDRASLGERGETKYMFEADLKSKLGMTESKRVPTREQERAQS